MIESLSRLFGFVADEENFENYEPIYGLPKQSLDEWLSRNPKLRQEYDATLRDFNSHLRHSVSQGKLPTERQP